MLNVNKVKFLSERTSGVPPVILICNRNLKSLQMLTLTCPKFVKRNYTGMKPRKAYLCPCFFDIFRVVNILNG